MLEKSKVNNRVKALYHQLTDQRVRYIKFRHLI